MQNWHRWSGSSEHHAQMLTKLYLTRDLKGVAKLPMQVSQYFREHWQGKLTEAAQTFPSINIDALEKPLAEILRADRYLLQIKLARCEVQTPHGHLNSSLALVSLIYHYGTFSQTFFINHKRAWVHLLRATWHALRLVFVSQHPLQCCLFLWGHMGAANGRFTLISALLTRLTRYPESSVEEHLSPHPKPFMMDLPAAVYPYTLLLLAITKHRPVHHVPITALSIDPYYQHLQLVSLIYAYSYTGQLSHADIASQIWLKRQSEPMNHRYQLLGEVLTLMGASMHGFGHNIAPKAAILERSFQTHEHFPLITSQFYRAMTIIALSVKEFSKAERYWLKANVARQETRAFTAWEIFDRQLKFYIKHKIRPDWRHGMYPHRKVNLKDSTGDAMTCLWDVIHQIPSLTFIEDTELASCVGHILQKRHPHLEFKIKKEAPNLSMLTRNVRIGDEFLELTHPDHSSQLDRLLNIIGPALYVIAMSVNRERDRQSQLMMNRITIAKQAATQSVIHDIKSPLSNAQLVLRKLREQANWPQNSTMPTLMTSLTWSLQRMEQLIRFDCDSSNQDQQNHLSVRYFIKQCIAAIESHSYYERLQWHVDVPAQIVSTLPLGAISRIIENLLINCIEASGGIGHITIDGEVLTKKNMLKLQITNPINRHADHFDSPKSERGRGLKIVSSLIKAAGGMLEYGPSSDRRFQVSCTLPIANTSHQEVAQTSLTAPGISSKSADKMHVAVLDQRRLSEHFWKETLQPAHVFIYRDIDELLHDFAQGAAGIAKSLSWLICHQNSFDSKMSEINECIREIRQHFGHRIIVMTDHPEEMHRFTQVAPYVHRSGEVSHDLLKLIHAKIPQQLGRQDVLRQSN